MVIVVMAWFPWIFLNPLHLLFMLPLPSIPPTPLLILYTVIYAVIMFYVIRQWLRIIARRNRSSAAGVDVVETGTAMPETGDEWGRATRPYRRKEKPPKVAGTQSDIRKAPVLDAGFYVKSPDLDTGEELFVPEELQSKAMTRSVVSSGGWVKKRVSSRSMGSLKASETTQHGRPVRSRSPIGEIDSIHFPSTIMAAVTRHGVLGPDEQLKIQLEDIRESVFSGKTPLTVLVIVDVSLSMKASMKTVRQLLEKIERETRGSKDRIGIIAFKDSGAIEVQAPTTNWNKVYRALVRLRISGLTPLAEGLMKALETVKRERMRNRNIQPLVIVISDFAPNIPLAQSVGPGHAQYTPVRDLVKAARLLRKERVSLAAINVDPTQASWMRFLKRPYYDAQELAVLLRAREDGFEDPVETVLMVPEFRKSFGAFLVARVGGGRAYLASEVLKARSVLGNLLQGNQKKSRLTTQDLLEAEAYIAK
jgi:Mg-chelatase subunit ChlD